MKSLYLISKNKDEGGKIMKKLMFLMSFVVLFVVNVFAMDYSPIVSVDWLEKNLQNPDIVIIDIRKVEDFKSGHIPNSVSVTYTFWAVEKNGKKNELPYDEDLEDIIVGAGINKNSTVVLVGSVANTTELVNLTRVAWTLTYAGLEKISILDGGFNAWKKSGKVLVTEIKKPKSGDFKLKINKNIYADKEYVKSAIYKSIIVDTRLPEFFFGVSKLDFVARGGHIESAVNLPSAWIFTKDGNFKGIDDLDAIVKGVLGSDKAKEVITYCDTGRLASGWWFVLYKILGYKNVKMYDGSSEEWAKDNNLPMIKYSWK